MKLFRLPARGWWSPNSNFIGMTFYTALACIIHTQRLIIASWIWRRNCQRYHTSRCCRVLLQFAFTTGRKWMDCPVKGNFWSFVVGSTWSRVTAPATSLGRESIHLGQLYHIPDPILNRIDKFRLMIQQKFQDRRYRMRTPLHMSTVWGLWQLHHMMGLSELPGTACWTWTPSL